MGGAFHLQKRGIDFRILDPHGSCDNLGAFASLYAAHGADAHLFQRRVIQLASIVWFHLPSESDEIRPVNKNGATTYGLIDKLFNKSSKVVLTRDGEKTTITMASDYEREAKLTRLYAAMLAA